MTTDIGTVLLIDDDESIRFLVSAILTNAGYKVIVATNGGQGIHYLLSNPPPQAIVLDLRMPFMDGWDFMEAQCLIPEITEVPIVVYSAEPCHRPGFIPPKNYFTAVSKIHPERLAGSVARAIVHFH